MPSNTSIKERLFMELMIVNIIAWISSFLIFIHELMVVGKVLFIMN